MNYINIEGGYICHHEGSLYNWPTLCNNDGDVLLEIHEGSGDELYDYPWFYKSDKLPDSMFDYYFNLLLNYCKPSFNLNIIPS